MANFAGGANTKCPFYIKEAEKSITCEGCTENSTNMQRFETSEEKEHYQEQYCTTRGYIMCPWAASLAEKYANSVQDDANSVQGKTAGTIISILRHRKDLNQRQLAARVHVSRSYICDLEKDRRGGSAGVLVLLAKELGVDVKCFIETKGEGK